MATITAENRRQIRDPMLVDIKMEVAENVNITQYRAMGSYKSYDGSLGNLWPMRVLADLQDEGFLLDGSAEWYEEKDPSVDGKLGLRSNEGQDATLRVTGSGTISNLTLVTEGVETITWEGGSIPATGRDFIRVNGVSSTISFTPKAEHGRAMVVYVAPGLDIEINNENLISARVNLRCNLDPFATTLEASEIEIEMYYPEDLGTLFKYVGHDWPILYSAGYSDDMSEPRYFYLDDQVTWKDGVVTIHGIDAVPKLEETIKEGSVNLELDLLMNARSTIAGIREYVEARVPHLNALISSAFWDGARDEYPIRKECTMRDLLQRIMSLTQGNNKNNRVAYVDAGWPTFQNAELLNDSWTVQKEDLASIVETKVQNIEKITAPSEELYDEILKEGSGKNSADTVEVEKNQIVTFDYEGGQGSYAAAYYEIVTPLPPVSFTPSEAVFKATKAYNNVRFYYTPIIRTKGVKSYTNPNGKPGAVFEYDHILEGRVVTAKEYGSTERVNVLSPANIFKVERDTIEFDYKGDPRWQPYHKLNIITSVFPPEYFTVRITEIEITHEGGGTMAHVKCKYLSEDES